MAIRTILTEGEPALRKKSRPVTEFNDRLHILLDDMRQTLAEAHGAGLAAPQVGVLRRAVVVDVGLGEQSEILELINPVILEESGEQEGPEGCLSVPGRWGLVKRPMHVKVRAQNRYGKWYETEGDEIVARCFCHELEHLDGHLYVDRVTRFLTDEEVEAMREEQE